VTPSGEHLQTWHQARKEGPDGSTASSPEEFRHRSAQLALGSHRSVRDVAAKQALLGRQVAELESEREILKICAVFFGRETGR